MTEVEGGFMWGDKRRARAERVDTLVGEGTRIEGDVVFRGGMHVAGVVRGNVSAEGQDAAALLVLGEGGCIEGDIKVPHVVINGRVDGDVRAGDSLELGASARVAGALFYARLEMAVGAEVNGRLQCLSKEAAPKSLPVPVDFPTRPGRSAEKAPPATDKVDGMRGKKG